MFVVEKNCWFDFMKTTGNKILPHSKTTSYLMWCDYMKTTRNKMFPNRNTTTYFMWCNYMKTTRNKTLPHRSTTTCSKYQLCVRILNNVKYLILTRQVILPHFRTRRLPAALITYDVWETLTKRMTIARQKDKIGLRLFYRYIEGIKQIHRELKCNIASNDPT